MTTKVYKVKILNRLDGCGERLAGCKIEIDEQHFGDLPNVTEAGKWYTIKNDKGVTGKQIKVSTTRKAYL